MKGYACGLLWTKSNLKNLLSKSSAPPSSSLDVLPAETTEAPTYQGIVPGPNTTKNCSDYGKGQCVSNENSANETSQGGGTNYSPETASKYLQRKPVLTRHTLISVCILSTLFSIPFLRC